MFGLGKSRREKLEAKFKRLLEESYQLSHTNRMKSDEKAVEASEIWKQLEELKNPTR